MKLSTRILIAVLIFLIDAAVFFLPLSAFFLVIVLCFRPIWVKRAVDEIYKNKPGIAGSLR